MSLSTLFKEAIKQKYLGQTKSSIEQKSVPLLNQERFVHLHLNTKKYKKRHTWQKNMANFYQTEAKYEDTC